MSSLSKPAGDRATPTLDDRFAAHARDWHAKVDEIRWTETSQLGFGTRDNRPVVLKVIRRENSEEWQSGRVLEAFGGAGVIRPIVHCPGAVLLPRLVPGSELVSLSLADRDDEATEIIASLLRRMSDSPVDVPDSRCVDQMLPEFATFRDAGRDFIPLSHVERAEELFSQLCAAQRNVRLLHGDLHHYNVLFDEAAGWVAIDPWGVRGEIEFEIGAALRNPVGLPNLLGDPAVVARRLKIYERALGLDADRALKWAFATTILAILWPADPWRGIDLRSRFADAAHSMLRLLE
jgi:streptomycin 6-kinase